jgi:deferrochelatase/peroxidase EfeB
VAFNRDTRKQFVPMQQALSTKDEMMEYVEHTSSGHFAVPPGVKEGGFWGDTLFR